MFGSSAAAPARALAVPLTQREAAPKPAPWPYLFFFVSGFPALLYQIVWQRALFTLYGVNIESVTMVVTAFMLGLGLGSLLGGMVSRSVRLPLLPIFGSVELLIAGYGIFSLRLFHWAADFTAGAPPLQTGLIAFALVVLPTVLMGSTLPILVSHAVRVSHNVGTSVGALYAANTFGSASACFCAGFFLMRWLGESKTVALAAALNAVVGASVLAWHFVSGNSASSLRQPLSAKPNSVKIQEKPAASSARENSSGIGFPLALLVAAVAGFISLGYEIVWYRLFSFTTGGEAKSFAFLLGAYLAGIAVGSLACNRICSQIKSPRTFTRFLVASVFGANLLGFLVGPILFNLVIHASLLWTLVPIGLAAACLGAVFPMLCHISIRPDEAAGTGMSYLYLSNIVGSALGSYLTGSVLMDFLPLRNINVVLAVLGLVLVAVLVLKARFERRGFLISAGAVVAASLLVLQGVNPLYHDMYQKMLLKGGFPIHAFGGQIAETVETKSGVITVTKTGVVHGGGIYDGRFNISLVNDSNGLLRPFALSYFHPNPRHLLMIGLATGSWAQVVVSHPQVEDLTVVEINPGYLRLIQQHPEVRSILHNPKVHIDIDDGRRWLVRNPERKFDAVVMNSTFHWRSSASNLLSVEFLKLIRQHLNPGGILLYNATDSPEVMATGLSVFPYGMRIGSCLLVSDSPLQLDANRWRQVLSSYKIDGNPVFDLSQEQHLRRFEEVMSLPLTVDREVPTKITLESADHVRARTAGSRIITDDNMGTEWLR
jgi:predicted membrane-bound spermidine synthase